MNKNLKTKIKIFHLSWKTLELRAIQIFVVFLTLIKKEIKFYKNLKNF